MTCVEIRLACRRVSVGIQPLLAVNQTGLLCKRYCEECQGMPLWPSLTSRAFS